MSIAPTLQKYLDQNVTYELIPHEPTFSSMHTAEACHVSGDGLAKGIVLRRNGGYMLAVLPSTHRIDLERMKRELDDEDVEMASEQEIEQLFPDCETGALPPFGSLYHLPTIVDDSLTQDERIVFDAQCHDEAIRMTFRDFQFLEHPRIGHFARPC